MAGPRFTDWSHFRFVGDREAAMPYVNEARKLMGYVQEDAARMGLGVHSMRRELKDGAVIVAEKHGEIPRMTIVPPRPEAAALRRTLEGFHLTWGGSEEGWNPVVFCEPPTAPDEDGWRDWVTSFYSPESLGYADTPEDRRTAPYIDVFGFKTADGERLLPCNGTWVHRDTDEAVAWFRGYTGYWPEHYRHPRVNYGNWVTIYGHPVLVLGAGWRILSAAMRDGWLYVVIAENLGVMNPPALPPAPAFSGQVWFSQPYSDDEFTYAVWRLALNVETQPDSGIETYVTDPNSAQMLWRGDLRRAYGAWSFNADCTEVVTIQLPRQAVYCLIYVVDGNDWVASPIEDASYPTVESHRIAINLNHEDDPPSATFSSVLAPDLIAEEDGVQLEIVEHTRPTGLGAYGRNDYRIGDWTIPVTEQVNDGGVQWYERRVMAYAHLPSRTLLLYRWRTEIQPARYVSAGFQLFVDGQEVEIDDQSAVETAFGAGLFDSISASNHFRAKGIMYDDGVGTSWFRPMDAMSFLLGFGFTVQGALPTSGTPGEPGYGFQGCPHYGYTYSPLNHSPHTAAGGYVFGSVGGESGHFWGTGFTLAEPYGANYGSYTDNDPSTNPTTNYIGAGATYGGNTLASVGFQSMLALSPGGVPSPFSTIANQNRYLPIGTHGDAATLLDAAVVSAGGAPWRRFTLSHTGKPRKNQRGVINGS